jgi:hypothetical protein
VAAEGKSVANLNASQVRDLILGAPGSLCSLYILPATFPKYEPELATMHSDNNALETEETPRLHSAPSPNPQPFSSVKVDPVLARSPSPATTGAGLPPRPRRGCPSPAATPTPAPALTPGSGAAGGAGGPSPILRRGNAGAGPPKPVEIMLTLDLDYAGAGHHGSHSRQSFEHNVCKDLSYASGFPLKLFKIKQIRAGSIILDVEIFPDPSGGGPAPVDLANDLAQQVRDSKSPLMMGALTCHTIEILVIPKSPFKVFQGPYTPVPPRSPQSIPREGSRESDHHRHSAHAAAPRPAMNQEPDETQHAAHLLSSQETGSQEGGERAGVLPAVMVPRPHTPGDVHIGSEHAAAPRSELKEEPGETKHEAHGLSLQENGTQEEGDGTGVLSAVIVSGPHSPQSHHLHLPHPPAPHLPPKDTHTDNLKGDQTKPFPTPHAPCSPRTPRSPRNPRTPRGDEQALEEGEWVRQWSNSKQRNYYYNTITGESAWKPRKHIYSHVPKPNLEAQWHSEDSDPEQRPVVIRIRNSKKKASSSRNRSLKPPSDDTVRAGCRAVGEELGVVAASRPSMTENEGVVGPVARMPLEFITGIVPVSNGSLERDVRGSSPLKEPDNIERPWEWHGDQKNYHCALCIELGQELPEDVIDPAGMW